MTGRTIVRHSEEVQRALRWIAEQLQEDPKAGAGKLVSEAGPRFNLSPADQEALMHLVRKHKAQIT